MANLKPSERILCALDTTNVAQASTLAATLSSDVGGIKLGLEFFGANGPQGYKEVIKANQNIFLDLKLQDLLHLYQKGNLLNH